MVEVAFKFTVLVVESFFCSRILFFFLQSEPLIILGQNPYSLFNLNTVFFILHVFRISVLKLFAKDVEITSHIWRCVKLS